MRRAFDRELPPLELLVFVVGSASLGAEIAAARLMAPFFGASTIVWANVIGVVLVSLSVGYWVGGRFADRHPHRRGLCTLVLVAALAVGLIPFVADPFLDVSVDALDEVQAGAFFGSLIAVSVLVAPPVMLLGAVSPYAIRLAVERVEESGAVAGRIYAISTVGSLAGAWLSALLLIPAARNAPHLPDVCARLRPRRRGRGTPPARGARAGGARRCCSRCRSGTIKASRRQEGARRGGDALPVRARGRGVRRRSQARAERGPGGALDLPARLLSDRRLLGRVPACCRSRRSPSHPGGSRSSATPPEPRRAPTGTTFPRTYVDGVEIDARADASWAAAGSTCATHGSRSSTRTPARSCAGPTAATT